MVVKALGSTSSRPRMGSANFTIVSTALNAVPTRTSPFELRSSICILHPMRVLIVGCGYVGLPLGQALVQQGHQVFGVRRTNSADAEIKSAGIIPLAADITQAESLRALPLEGGFDWVVNTVSSSRGGADEYREVYLHGTRNLIEWLAAHSTSSGQATPLKKFVFTSSTSVY